MKKNPFLILIGAVSVSSLLSSCGGMLKSLRGNDLQDEVAQREPVSGGMWPEHGWLQDSEEEDRSEALARIENQVKSGEAKAKKSANREIAGNSGTMRTKKEDFIDQAQTSGSLWASDGQTNYFFTKNRVKTVGDIVSIQIEPAMVKDISSEIKRTLSQNEREFELETAKESGANRQVASDAKAGEAAAAVAEEAEPKELSFYELDISKNVGVKEGDTLMAEITERYPNGNYKVSGSKKVPYRQSSRLVQFTGIARSKDIDEVEQVSSNNFYEYKLQVERGANR